MENLYEILGVKETALLQEIKTAYFKLAKKHHPDASDRAEIKALLSHGKVTAFYLIREQRRAYDQTLGGKIEKILVDEPHPTPFKKWVQRMKNSGKKRCIALRKIYLKAILRIIGFGLALVYRVCFFLYSLNGIAL